MLAASLLMAAVCSILGYYLRQFYRRLGGAPCAPRRPRPQSQTAAPVDSAAPSQQVAHLQRLVSSQAWTISRLRQETSSLASNVTTANNQARKAQQRARDYEQLVEEYAQRLRRTRLELEEKKSALQQVQTELAELAQALQFAAPQGTLAAFASFATANPDEGFDVDPGQLLLQASLERVLSNAGGAAHTHLDDSGRQALQPQARHGQPNSPQTPTNPPQRPALSSTSTTSLPSSGHGPRRRPASQSSSSPSSSATSPSQFQGVQFRVGDRGGLIWTNANGHEVHVSSEPDHVMYPLQAEARAQNIPFVYRPRAQRRQ